MRTIPTENLGLRKPVTGPEKKQAQTAETEMPSVMLIDRPLPKGMVADPSSATHKEALKSSTTMNNSPEVITSQSKTDEGWVRQGFPSHCLVYKVKEILVKPLDIGTMKALAAAIPDKSFTQMLDALDSRISMDIRDLTVPDFYFFLYWLRLNSYPRSPLTINWVSKYGNKNSTRVMQSQLNILELEMTKDEIDDWHEKGLDIPRTRDMEVLQSPDLEAGDKWEIEYGQYMYVDTVDDDYLNNKLKNLELLGPDAISLVNEFSQLITHGVVEEVKVTDSEFDRDKAIIYIEEETKQLSAMASQIVESGDPQAITAATGLIQHVESRMIVLEKLKKDLADGVDSFPEEEVVTIGPADLTLLFP